MKSEFKIREATGNDVELLVAFTVQEAREADLLLHVVDGSHRLAWDHIDVVEDTLAELEAVRMPKLMVLNKIDLADEETVQRHCTQYDAVPVSALDKSTFANFLNRAKDMVVKQWQPTGGTSS